MTLVPAGSGALTLVSRLLLASRRNVSTTLDGFLPRAAVPTGVATVVPSVYCVPPEPPPVMLTLRLVPVADNAVPPANISELTPMTLPLGAVPHAVGEPSDTEFHCVVLIVHGPEACVTAPMVFAPVGKAVCKLT